MRISSVFFMQFSSKGALCVVTSSEEDIQDQDNGIIRTALESVAPSYS